MGYNAGVMLIRATALVSGDLKTVELVAGQKPVAHAANNGALSLFNGYFDTKNYATMGPVDNETDSSQIIGYNVYRTDVGATPPYTKLNTAPVTATTYLDVIPNTVANYGNYKYYVTSLFNDSQANTFLCESPGSDTLQIAFPAVGVNELGKESIVVYPNPATDFVNVKSDATISTIEVINFVGQSVFTMNTVDSKTAKINVTSAARRRILCEGYYLRRYPYDEDHRYPLILNRNTTEKGRPFGRPFFLSPYLCSMISVNNLSVQFGGEPLFDHISFFIQDKDRIGLVGKNGAGKSTLLKIIKGHTESR